MSTVPRAGSAIIAAAVVSASAGADGPPPGFTVAFIGDQGLGADAQAVLQLIHDEGADAVVHSGDFDYDDDPQAWIAMIDGVLGPDFPYFASVGNHDDDEFYGPDGYQAVLEARMQKLGIGWEGDLGARSSHKYQGILFLLTAPGIFGDGDTVHAPFIQEQLEADHSAWRISSWHVLMRKMQIDDKNDQSGWGVYEESRRGGAIVATAHAHNYARSHALASCPDPVVASAEPTFSIRSDHPATAGDEGVTFVFHNGLGGRSIRDQERCLPAEPPYGCDGVWASIYAEDQNAQHGALFGVFNYQGEPCKARFYFKDVAGNVVDEFFVESELGPCDPCAGDVDGSGVIGHPDFDGVLDAWGDCAPPCPADTDGDDAVGVLDLLSVLARWGPCGAEAAAPPPTAAPDAPAPEAAPVPTVAAAQPATAPTAAPVPAPASAPARRATRLAAPPAYAWPCAGAPVEVAELFALLRRLGLTTDEALAVLGAACS